MECIQPALTVRSGVWRRALAIGLLLSLGCPVGALAQTTAPQRETIAGASQLDVRLVVDVSGSMAQADPNGLLAPALQLLLEALPEGSHAGVWTFAQQVNALVRHARVTPLWRTQAKILTEKLPAVGLRTALGAAIDRASWDRARAPGAVNAVQKHLILLTDGEVDLADASAVNLAARAELLTQRLPELAAAGFRVHAVALSDRGDVALLQEAARLTGGRFARANSLATLPEDLLALFAEIGPVNRIPLRAETVPVTTASPSVDDRSNQADRTGFRVEAGVQELTLFIAKDAQRALRLQDPDGTRFDRARIPPGARWHISDRYELLTLRQPMAGRWRVQGEALQVLAYGGLHLRLLDRPRTVAPGSILSFRFALEAEPRGQALAPEFLQLVQFRAALEADRGQPAAAIELDGRSGAAQVVLTGLAGAQSAVLTLEAQGPTFERILRFPFDIAHPLRVELQPSTAPERPASLWALLNQPGLAPGTARVAAGLRVSPGPQRWYPLRAQPAGMWLAQLPPELTGRVEIELDVHANYLNGGVFNYRTRPLFVELPVSEVTRFNFTDSGRQDAPARLVDQAVAAVATNAAAATAQPLASASQPAAEPASDRLTASVAEPATAAEALLLEAATPPLPEASETPPLPLWFAAFGLLIPLVLVLGLGWRMARAQPLQAEPVSA